MEDFSSWVDGNVGDWLLESLSYEFSHPLLRWATGGKPRGYSGLFLGQIKPFWTQNGAIQNYFYFVFCCS